MKTTTIDLPLEIEKLIPENERTDLVKQIIREARQGEFHDYRNEKYICGKIQVAAMLRETRDLRLQPIIDGVFNGDYDESPNEDDVVAMKKDWVESGASEESFNTLFKK